MRGSFKEILIRAEAQTGQLGEARMDVEISILLPKPRLLGENFANGHDISTRAVLAQRLAGLCGGRVIEPGVRSDSQPFFIPADTLTLKEATQFGILSEEQLYGGAVPEPFVATKIISHGLWDAAAIHPFGWARTLSANLGDAVLRGYSVFSADEARVAGRMLLELGPIRLKDVEATSGEDRSSCAIVMP